jgi:hypothetical protein
MRLAWNQLIILTWTYADPGAGSNSPEQKIDPVLILQA